MKIFIYCIMLNFIFIFQILAGDNEKTAKAKKINSKIHIDGVLNEPEWKDAIVISDFTQRDPVEGNKPSERTEIRVLYDNENLYFGCMMFDSEPDKIVARLTRRDNEIESDCISLRLDTYHDHKTAFEFTLLASGTKIDILQYYDAMEEDASWDAVWDAGTRITNEGWIAEFKIPFKVLRFDNISANKTWGFNIKRRITRRNEEDFWVMIPKNQSGFISRFGHLEGLENIESPTRLEILPYIVSSNRWRPETFELKKENIFKGNGGFDLKYGISSNITLDLTVNPDFGQVEADPAVMNLTTFETFYPEKRPFFIEGTQILRFSGFGMGDGLFYSRRVGKRPMGDYYIPPKGFLKDYPENSAILSAVKITGKNENGLSFGILDALTGNEFATIIDSNGREERQKVGFLTNYSVIRVKQDILENSTIGGILTSVIRENLYPSFTGGADWKFLFDKSIYSIDGFWAFSNTTTPSMERAFGSAGRFTFSKIGGDHWLYNLSSDYTAKKYNINDIGFFRRPNDYGGGLEIKYKDDNVYSLVRYWDAELNYQLRWNFDKVNLYKDIRLSFETIFLNFYGIEGSYGYSFGGYDDRETRIPGRLYKKPKSSSLSMFLHNNWSDPYVIFLEGNFQSYENGAKSYSFSPSIDLKPLSNLSLMLGLNYSIYKNYEAWADIIWLNNGEIKTIFGDRNTDEFNFTLKGSITFTHNLTLETYSQFFFGKGEYKNYKEWASDDTFIPYDYKNNRDFNETFFRINTVLRWEYLPGSTLYLVWTQTRGSSNSVYATPFSDNLSNTFIAPMDNTIMLKVSYWMNI